MDKERLRELMGYSTSPKTRISEGIDKPYKSVTVGNLTLGVFREGGAIYIKESRDGGSTFDYIGGIENKGDYRCNGIPSAIKKLEYMESALLKENVQGSTFFSDGYQVMGEEAEEEEQDAPEPSAEAPDMDGEEPEPEAEPSAEVEGGESEEESSFDFVDDPSEEPEPETDMGDEEGIEPEGEEGAEDFGGDSEDGDSQSGDEDSPMSHAGKAQNHISQIDMSAEEGMNAMKQVLAAVENAVEGTDQAGEVASELRKMANAFEGGETKDEGYSAMVESKSFAQRRKRRKQIKESLEARPKEEVAKLIEENKIMQKPRIQRKMELYREKMRSIKLMEENLKLKKGE